jgi:hypothetical protein
MPETPAAAAPAVTPAAPVAAPVAAPAAPVAAAPVAPAAPAAAAPAAPVTPAAAEPTNLLDAAVAPTAAEPTQAEKVAAAQKVIDDARAQEDPNSDKNWVLAEGILGKGEKPSWFKADKYKSVEAQAKAYNDLESRFGAFKGAPPEGKYEFKPPENLAGVQIDMNNPLMKGFNEWAAKNQLNQDGYNQVLGMLAQYEANQAPNFARIKAQVGENADQRITAVNQWSKANLDAAGQAAIRAAMTQPNAAEVFKTVEQLIAKTSQARMPKPGDDVATPGAGGAEAVMAMQGAKGPDGKRLYDTDPKYRQKVAAAWKAHYDANPVQRDRRGNIRG